MTIAEHRPSRFLIVSLGSIGRRHLHNLRTICPSSEIAVLRLSGNSKPDYVEHADLVTDSIDQAIAFAPQAAIVASPASTHESIATTLANHGIHLLIEKPLACDAESASRIATSASTAGVICMVGYNLRFKRSLLKVKELLKAGTIGAVLSVRAEVGQYLPTWRPTQDYRDTVSARASLGGGVLLELSHELDYLLWLFGMPDKVNCTMGHYSDLEIDVEDLVDLTMQYASPRQLINVHLDFLQRNLTRQCRFIGANGTLIWDAVGDRICLQGMVDPKDQQVLGPFDSDGNRAYLDELEYFLDSVAQQRSPEPDAHHGHRVLKVVDAARIAARSGSSVTLEAQ